MKRQLQIVFAISVALTTLIACPESKENNSPGDGPEPEGLPQPEGLITSVSSPSNFLVLSDIHLDSGNTNPSKAGRDTRMDLWEKMKTKVSSVLTGPEKPDFVLYLGDLPVHNTFDKDHENAIGMTLTGLRELVEGTDIPLLYLPGNNDALIGNYCEFSHISTGPGSAKPPFSTDAKPAAWPMINSRGKCAGNPVPCDQNLEHRDDGYYSAYPLDDHGLRVIAMNTVMFSITKCKSSAGWADRPEEAAIQLQWLKSQLQEARANSEKVIIAMHIPPGNDIYCTGDPGSESCNTSSLSQMWSTYFVNQKPLHCLDSFLTYVSKYQDDIVGIFTSHTHMDEIRILKDTQGPIELAISCPGISPNHKNNPAFKQVTYDKGNTWELTDFTTMWYDLEKSPAKWADNSYTFSETYGCTQGGSMYECIKSMDENAVYQAMINTFYAGAGLPCCDVQQMMTVHPGQ